MEDGMNIIVVWNKEICFFVYSGVKIIRDAQRKKRNYVGSDWIVYTTNNNGQKQHS